MTTFSGTSPFSPPPQEFARALFAESIRHLEDARILHDNGRYPACSASCLKTIEMSLKAVIVLDGAMGWWSLLFSTHTPLNVITNHAILKRHYDALNAYNTALVDALLRIEKYESRAPTSNLELGDERNPEYPYVGVDRNDPTGTPRLYTPTAHFTETESRRIYNVSCDLLAALQTLYTTVGTWGFLPPGRL